MRHFIFLLLLIPVFCYGQSRNNVWCFGDSAGVTFNGTSTSLFTSASKSRGSCASISDSSGQLLFYAYTRAAMAGNTTLVKNRNGNVMNNGSNVVGEAWYEELCIVPDPGNTNQYYLFSVGVAGSNQGFYYSIIDMTLDSGCGDVVQKNIQLQTYPAIDCVEGIKHGNGRDWWIISRRGDSSNNEFYEYLVTPSGILGPYIYTQGSATSNNLYYIAFNKEGNLFASISARGLIEVFAFDRCTGAITLNVNIRQESTNPVPWFFGVEISPSSRFLYVSQTGISTPFSYLFQFDLHAPNIFNSVDTLWQYDSIFNAAGSLRLAPDEKIYLASAWNDGVNWNYPYPDSAFYSVNNNLSVVNFPDSEGFACSFQPFSFNLGTGRCYWGLPNNPDYELGPDTNSFCDTLLNINDTGAPTQNKALTVFYHLAWQTAFINASGLEGKTYSLHIVNMQGKELFIESGNLSSEYFTKDFRCHHFSAGTYIVLLETDRERLVKRFIIE